MMSLQKCDQISLRVIWLGRNYVLYKWYCDLLLEITLSSMYGLGGGEVGEVNFRSMLQEKLTELCKVSIL